jgi:hypothetical protein
LHVSSAIAKLKASKQRLKGFQMDLSATAVVIATVMGPILAVQAQKYLERHRDQKRAKDNIFRILMATRAARLVEAFSR